MITGIFDNPPVTPALFTGRKWLPAQEPATSESQSFPGKGNLRHILVIDDETTIADSLCEILNGHGYDAQAVYSGPAAIEIAKKRCPDLVIADVIMPRLNGIETVLAIRELCPITRILLFSGQAGTADLLTEARALGHQFELLPKPIHPDRLLKRLENLRNF